MIAEEFPYLQIASEYEAAGAEVVAVENMVEMAITMTPLVLILPVKTDVVVALLKLQVV